MTRKCRTPRHNRVCVEYDIQHSFIVPVHTGIARLCCDSRLAVRSQALTYLQRALLVHDQHTLSAYEWESCFNKVITTDISKGKVTKLWFC